MIALSFNRWTNLPPAGLADRPHFSYAERTCDTDSADGAQSSCVETTYRVLIYEDTPSDGDENGDQRSIRRNRRSAIARSGQQLQLYMVM